ncbi:hypothetical protein C0989_011313 [Termitomyces sp. Mn162]|nr:hypothetical protein C0989_011313 [Termitomyces sp. Mn162]
MMVKQCFSAKKKSKGKAKEPKPSTATHEQITHLLQQLYKAGVPEDISADVLKNPVVQLALAQVLNELDIVQNQRDEDLFQLTLGKGKCVASLPDPPEAKKACTEPSVFVEGFSTQRALLVPYDDVVPASDDQMMNKHLDFKVALSTAGLSKPVAAPIRLPKPAMIRKRSSKPFTEQASTAKPAIVPVEADNSVVVATLIAFPANVL